MLREQLHWHFARPACAADDLFDIWTGCWWIRIIVGLVLLLAVGFVREHDVIVIGLLGLWFGSTLARSLLGSHTE